LPIPLENPHIMASTTDILFLLGRRQRRATHGPIRPERQFRT
jgi:hypothetical protein